MITLQHSLVTLFGLRGDEAEFDREIPYVLIPDAIRRYCGPRPYSHFEETPDGREVSYLHFPRNLRSLTKDNIGNERMYLATGYRPCVLGERTHLEKFEQTNGDLPPMYYSGVKKHLVQDIIFDEFVRSEIGLDCSRRFESMYPPEETTGKNVGIYVFTRERKGSNGESLVEQETFDGNGVRKFIADFENQGVYILAYMLYKSYGITVNQEWFDKHVKTVLDREYSEDLAKGTYQYMKIPEEINKRITEHDWSHLEDGPIPLKKYIEMYERVIKIMPDIDAERISKEQPETGTRDDD
jgi:hypothetical protein